MEMIYRNAVMTMANASKENNSADMPLPGVQPDSRAPFQQVHNIAGLKVVVSRRYPQPQAKQISAWATRAWTLQEEILSGRILYISDTHCWFQCPDCYFSEDVCLESAVDASKQSISTEHSFLTEIRKAVRPTKEQKPRTTWISIHSTFEVSKPTVPITLSEVFELIEAYTTRRATFRSDTLRAINGVLRRASSLDHGLTTTYHYGLPVTAFDYALCWLEDDHDPAKRRQGFPSWSWAGWVSPVKFPMGKPSFAAIGRSFSAMSLFTNALLSPEAKTFDLNISRQLINYFNKREDLENTEGDVEENRSFEELRNCYGICVSPKASIYTEHHLGQQNSLPREHKNQSLIFSTSYAKLRVDSTTRNVVSFDKAPSCRVYSLRSPRNSEVQLGIIRLNREWRESQPEVLELDFIVIRATPSEEFEPYWHNSKSPKPSSSPAPADWKIFLMCVAWIDGEVLEGKPRKAERITLAMVHEKRDCTRLHKYKDDDRENTYFLPSARDWMSVEPKPVEVLVELL
jgi:hypothetical protein